MVSPGFCAFKIRRLRWRAVEEVVRVLETDGVQVQQFDPPDVGNLGFDASVATTSPRGRPKSGGLKRPNAACQLTSQLVFH